MATYWRTCAPSRCWIGSGRRRRASCAPTGTSRRARRASPARCSRTVTTRTCPGTGSSAPTGRSRRAPASARSWRPRACRSPARASTCGRRGSRPSVWHQREIRLEARPRGFHLVTREIESAVPELGDVRIGLAHLFIRHTSAGLTLNENASPDVRRDFESFFNAAVPEDAPYWTHTVEGPDDMPAHVKASLLGPALSLPVRDGRFALGTWQGVYLCEHRDRGGPRSLVATLHGRQA